MMAKGSKDYALKKFEKFSLIDVIKGNIVFIVLILLLLAINFIKIPYQVEMPGGVINLSDRIKVDGKELDVKGSYNMAYVEVAQGSIVYYLTTDASCLDTIDITYLANAGSDTVTNLPTSSDNTYDSINNTITLSDKVPVRQDYTFVEWNTRADGNGTSYDPSDVIAIGTGTGEINTNTDLYAIWRSFPAPSSSCNTPITGATYMQDITPSNKAAILASMTTGSAYYLRDSRDEKPYCVGKLADGNLWMLDNLALDPTDATTAANMSASNTNATAEAITNYLNGGNTNNTAGWSSTAVVNATSDSYIAPMINNASVDTLVTSYGLAAVNGQAKVGI